MELLQIGHVYEDCLEDPRVFCYGRELVQTFMSKMICKLEINNPELILLTQTKELSFVNSIVLRHK